MEILSNDISPFEQLAAAACVNAQRRARSARCYTDVMSDLKSAGKQRPRVGTRQKLIRAASKEFALKGYDGATLEEIASAVGIKAASIFKHFSGKQALYDAILAELQETLAVPSEQFMKQSDEPIEAILIVWEYYWDFCEKHPHYVALLIREAFDSGNPRIKRLRIASDYTLSLARAYILHAQGSGQIRQFDVDGYILWAITYSMTFFGVPGLRAHLWHGPRAKASVREGRQAFLQAARYFLEPR